MNKSRHLIILFLLVAFNITSMAQYNPCDVVDVAMRKVDSRMATGDLQGALDMLQKIQADPKVQNCEQMTVVNYKIGLVKEQLAKQTPKNNNNTANNTSNSNLPPVIQNLIANMVRVEGGTFTMGATSEQGSDAYSYEKPKHQVTLSSFSIGKYEVTQEEWQAVMGSNPSYFKGAKLPVEKVSWDDCQEFIRRLNQMTGKSFRLPTEAEWEFAARGDNRSKHYKYSGSNNLSSVAWYYDNSGSETHPVGQKSPNELGLYDMSGNVWEWCADWYDKYSKSAQTDPKGSSSGSHRVLRGGSWGSSAGYCRVSNRSFKTPSNSNSYLGLRLAL